MDCGTSGMQVGTVATAFSLPTGLHRAAQGAPSLQVACLLQTASPHAVQASHLPLLPCRLPTSRPVPPSITGLRTVRQILVARPGQRPCAWIDLETARNTMLRWAGYCMVGITALGLKAAEGGGDVTSGAVSPSDAATAVEPAGVECDGASSGMAIP